MLVLFCKVRRVVAAAFVETIPAILRGLPFVPTLAVVSALVAVGLINESVIMVLALLVVVVIFPDLAAIGAVGLMNGSSILTTELLPVVVIMQHLLFPVVVPSDDEAVTTMVAFAERRELDSSSMVLYTELDTVPPQKATL